MSATAPFSSSGVLPTAMPRARASGTLMWSTPTPMLLITRKAGNRSISSASMRGWP
jgi:hypothetical protein